MLVTWIAAVVCLVGIVTMVVGDFRENINLMVAGGIVAFMGYLCVMLRALP